MDCELMLKEVSDISKKYELLSQKNGDKFNIFEITSIHNKEVIICRMIGELLNPSGSHSQGSTYLKSFVENTLSITKFNYKKAKVFLEYVIENNRRIDIVITDENYFIPIEVKIKAGDQENQCNDYLKYAKNADMYYLTLYGDKPSIESYSGNVGKYGVKVLSFSEDILKWLKECVEDEATSKIPPIKEVILQLIKNIKNLTNQRDGGCEMEVRKLLEQSSENIKSAVLIEENLKKCKTELIKSIFETLEKRLVEKGLKKVENKDNNYYYIGERTEKFYDGKANPGLSFVFKENVKENIKVILRIEIDHRIFCGFHLLKDNQWEKNLLTQEEIKKIFKVDGVVGSSMWMYSEYLPEGDKNFSPNFRVLNEEYYKLYDKKYFDKFIDKSVERVLKMYKNS